MEVTFNINVPVLDGLEEIEIEIESGSSVIFVGANGAGKTRLATHIEKTLNEKAHRISGHRALSLNPGVQKINGDEALQTLRVGYSGNNVDFRHREHNRWQGKDSVHLLDDFNPLLQVLFAEQSDTTWESHQILRSGNYHPGRATKFEKLIDIWERLLPRRKLHISGGDIQVSVNGENDFYSAADMSDGERAIFYLIGQVLVAAKDSLIIFDEPELHIHRSIMAKLWDELESAREDCVFVFITHDLEFASSRVADKYVLKEYISRPNACWNFEKVPVDTGFDEELTTLILGSRKPILFVEGDNNSLDNAIYRSCFPEWTVVPKGSCQDVIHAVSTMSKHASLTRITCFGIVDADGRTEEQTKHLQGLGVYTLPVSEVENILLLPSVSEAIAQTDGHEGEALEKILDELANCIFASLNSVEAIEAVVVKNCKRNLDGLLKKMDFSESKTVDELTSEYAQKTENLNIDNIAKQARTRINQAIESKDLPLLLASYGKKGLMIDLMAKHLKKTKVKAFKSWLIRVLNNNTFPGLVESIQEALPKIVMPREGKN